MLTPLTENGEEACSQYWPESGSDISFGEFTVNNLGEETNNGFITRQLSVLDTKVCICFVLFSWSNCVLVVYIQFHDLYLFTFFTEPAVSSSDTVSDYQLEKWWKMWEFKDCDWRQSGGYKGSKKNWKQVNSSPLPVSVTLHTITYHTLVTLHTPLFFSQWHCHSFWYVLLHSNDHWSLQDRGSCGCVPGGEGSQSVQTRGCPLSGESNTHTKRLL